MTIDTDSFIVFTEGTEVCKCDSFLDAYSALLDCTYALNLAYLKGLEKGCCLFRMFFLDLETIPKKLH